VTPRGVNEARVVGKGEPITPGGKKGVFWKKKVKADKVRGGGKASLPSNNGEKKSPSEGKMIQKELGGKFGGGPERPAGE